MEEGITRTRLEPNPGERFVPLRRQLGVTSFGCNQMVLEPGQRGRIHRHERQEEVYIVLAGTLTLLVEGEEHTLERDELVRVGPELRRQLVNKGPERLVLLALGGSGEHQGRDGMAYPDWETTEAASPQDVPLPSDLPAAAPSGQGAENVELVRSVIGDLPALFELLDDSFVIDNTAMGEILPEINGIFRGKRAAVRSIVEYVGAWDEYTFDVDELIDAGDSVVLFIRESGIGKRSRVPMEMSYAQIWTFEAGRMVRLRSFRDRDEALAAAGVG